MTSYKQLKHAADTLDKQADALEAAGKALEQTEQKLAALQQASTSQTKVAQEQEAAKAELAPMAKTASSALLESGLLSNQEQADVFAAQILGDHKVALAKLAQFAKHAGAPRRAEVVVDSKPPSQKTADERWDAKARAALERLNIG